ncbi:MAG: ABC transporter ATP-binding protein, partial [Lentisphaerae bacterium]|nr:ABC transporter ATP-binding protein [Lentisphaerota bacterium]
LTPVECLSFYGSLFGLSQKECRERTGQLLKMLNLEKAANRPVGEFSKGMARRVGLAQALINDPELIILDEPTSGLDPIGRRQIKDLIITLSQRGKTILLSSHLLAEIEDVCSRIIILFEGNMIVQGDMNSLLEESDSYRLTFRTENNQLVERALATIKKEMNIESHLEHPKRALEHFFLDAVRKAGSETLAMSGQVSDDNIAEFLSGKANE